MVHLDEIYDADDPRTSDVPKLINELIREYLIRQAENKIEPTEGVEEFQTVDEDFQDFHMSDDVFEQAWGIAKEFDFLPHSFLRDKRGLQPSAFDSPTLGMFSSNLIPLIEDGGYQELKDEEREDLGVGFDRFTDHALRFKETGRGNPALGITRGIASQYPTMTRTYPDIFDDMTAGPLHDEPRLSPRKVPFMREGESTPRPIKEGGRRTASVNLPGLGRYLNYVYGEDRIDDKAVKKIPKILGHEHGHAAIHDELVAEGLRGKDLDIAHEFGAHTLEGLSSEEVQERLNQGGLL